MRFKAHYFCLTLILLSVAGYSQDNWKQYPIGNSGISAYFSCNPGIGDVAYSPDSSKVYTLECKPMEGLTYSLIAVDFAIDLSNDEVENVLSSYLDYLKSEFKVVSSVGYDVGHFLPTHPSAVTITDSWDDGTSEISVGGCANTGTIGVLLVFRTKGSTINTQKEKFFQGFRFPGD
ncbi:MAG: hypothetical protein HXX13_18220 [Bacteroidetes bacterium]|nr:hypothetical protein [Bacteroidota bacterium]